jgi:hypothetical protein
VAQEEVNEVTEAISAPMKTMEMMDQDLPDSMRDRMEQIVGQIEALRDVTEDASIVLHKEGMQDKLNEALGIAQGIENELNAVMEMEESVENNASNVSNVSNVSNASFGGRRTEKKQRKHKKRTEKKRTEKKRTEKKRTLRKRKQQKQRKQQTRARK